MAIATPPPHPRYAADNDLAASCTEARTPSGSVASAEKTRAATSGVPFTSAGCLAASCPSA